MFDLRSAAVAILACAVCAGAASSFSVASPVVAASAPPAVLDGTFHGTVLVPDPLNVAVGVHDTGVPCFVRTRPRGADAVVVDGDFFSGPARLVRMHPHSEDFEGPLSDGAILRLQLWSGRPVAAWLNKGPDDRSVIRECHIGPPD